MSHIWLRQRLQRWTMDYSTDQLEWNDHAGRSSASEGGARGAEVRHHQPRRWAHRWQHFYMWALYALMAIRWHLLGDFQDVFSGHIGPHRVPRPRGWELVFFIGGKVVSLGLVLVIPLFFHPVWVVALF